MSKPSDNTSIIEEHDMQAIVARGFGWLPAACYIPFEISSPLTFCQWMLDQTIASVDSVKSKPGFALNLAFSFHGLRQLGLNQDTLNSFPHAFIEGMASEQRKRMLADHGDSDERLWWWGRKDQKLHGVLLAYGKSHHTIMGKLFGTENQDAIDTAITGMRVLYIIKDQNLPKKKEHFGFRDGISQPIIEGLTPCPEQDSQPSSRLGEFVLGYKNEYGEYPSTPSVVQVHDPDDRLTSVMTETEGSAACLKDLGRNGSFLVARQLQQNVKKFWSFVFSQSQQEGVEKVSSRACFYASKMVGRWPSGAPLSVSPLKDDHELNKENRIDYQNNDPHGYKCPFGAHTRRANPRNKIDEVTDSKRSQTISQRHRILRRGRNFGVPFDEQFYEDFDIERLLEKPDDAIERGLMFIALNTNIERQFEFIQQTWIHNKKFAGAYNEADPLMGDHDPRDCGETGEYRIPEYPVRRRLSGLTSFVSTRGGGYFFLPGLNALSYLLSLPSPSPTES